MAEVRLLVAGGGTGGHLFPGIAITEALSEMCPLKVLWVGTGRPVEKEILKEKKWQYEILDVRPIKGRSPVQLVKSLIHLPLSIFRALKLVRHFKPDLVLGVGGYVSGPLLVAGRIFGAKTAIHEQNSIPGLANRLASRFADRVFVGFPDVKGYFKGKDVKYFGNPIRKELLDSGSRQSEAQGDDVFRILVIGGSQGATGLNRLVSETFVLLKGSGIFFKAIHQTGEADFKSISEFYRKNGLLGQIEVKKFIHNMGIAYSWANLIICRAGASTISEVTALGKPSICIPYPHAADGHQKLNARVVVDAGAAISFDEMEVGPMTLASQIEELMKDEQRLKKMAQAAMSLGNRQASERIARSLLEMI